MIEDVLKQALEALEPDVYKAEYVVEQEIQKAITSLRQAIADLEKQDGDCQQCGGKGCVACDARKQEKRNVTKNEHDILMKAALRSGKVINPQQKAGQSPVNPYCCHSCFKASGGVMLDRMIVCSECGNKRCPKATDHNFSCTGSNEVGQFGSIYTQPKAEQEPVAWPMEEQPDGTVIPADPSELTNEQLAKYTHPQPKQ